MSVVWRCRRCGDLVTDINAHVREHGPTHAAFDNTALVDRAVDERRKLTGDDRRAA